MMEQRVEKFDITRGEKVVLGRLAGLENLFGQFVLELESYLFDRFAIPFQTSFEMKEGVKFDRFLSGVNHPQPIFVFDLAPLKGSSLLVCENRLANLIFGQKELLEQKKISVSNVFQLNTENYHHLKNNIATLLENLETSWSHLYPVQYQLKKLVSHPIKAKIMKPFDSCVVVKVSLQWKRFRPSMWFCFSNMQLDPIMNKVTRQSILNDEGVSRDFPENQEHFHQVLYDIPYEAVGVLGTLRVSRSKMREVLESGEIIPIQNALGANAVININGEPLLAGSLGAIADSYSLQVTGSYEEERTRRKQETKTFRKLSFRSLR